MFDPSKILSQNNEKGCKKPENRWALRCLEVSVDSTAYTAIYSHMMADIVNGKSGLNVNDIVSLSWNNT